MGVPVPEEGHQRGSPGTQDFHVEFTATGGFPCQQFLGQLQPCVRETGSCSGCHRLQVSEGHHHFQISAIPQQHKAVSERGVWVRGAFGMFTGAISIAANSAVGRGFLGKGEFST